MLDAVEEWGDGTCEKLAVTGLLMGLRPEERYGLDWADIDFRTGVAHIRRAYTAVSAAEGGNVLKETKTEKSTRDVPMPPEAAKRLLRLSTNGNIVASGPFLTGPRAGGSPLRRHARDGGRSCASIRAFRL